MPSIKRKAEEETLEIISWLEEHGIQVVVPLERTDLIGRDDLAMPVREIREKAELMLSLGGDGTLLHACRITMGTEIPLLGVNLGHLGFLTEISVMDWKSSLNRVLAGDFSIEDRMMLDCCVTRDGQSVFTGTSMNDVVVNHGGNLQLLRLSLNISGNSAGCYSADGMVVSTPTGSTAYSLSAGGPIVNPAVNCIVITAICPHTLSARPLVIPPDETVTIRERSEKNALVCLDGHTIFTVMPGDTIMINRSRYAARFVHLEKKFFQTIREKLKWFE